MLGAPVPLRNAGTVRSSLLQGLAPLPTPVVMKVLVNPLVKPRTPLKLALAQGVATELPRPHDLLERAHSYMYW